MRVSATAARRSKTHGLERASIVQLIHGLVRWFGSSVRTDGIGETLLKVGFVLMLAYGTLWSIFNRGQPGSLFQ